MTRSSRRGPWLPEEDAALISLVTAQGPNNWVRISQQIQHRSPKQCRERYHQNLKASLKHDPISVQEGELIEQMVTEMGKRWAEIARRLGNRSDNAVKNWWNGSMNRRRRNPTQVGTGFKQVGTRLQPIPFTSPGRSRSSLYARPPSDNQYRPANAYHDHAHHRTNGHNYDLRKHQSSHKQMQRPVEDYSSSLVASYSPLDHTSSRQLNPTSATSLSQPPPPQSQPPSSQSDPRYLSSWRELPPLRATSCYSIYASERRKSALDVSLVSPALSDASQHGIPSLRQPPSLVSDNQSIYSISPRTIPSPRSSLPAIHSHTNNYRQSWRDAPGTTYQSSAPPADPPDPALHCDGSLRYPPKYDSEHVAFSHLEAQPRPCSRPPLSPTDCSNVAKDSRMDVSNLLG